MKLQMYMHETTWLELKLKILRFVYTGTCNTCSSTVLYVNYCSYLYTWNHVDIQVHDTLAYTGTHSFSCLNYFCTELLSDCDIIFILVPKNILHTCFYAANISNEWTQWWINFLDCVTLHGCAECTCVYKLDCEIQDVNIYFRKIWDHLV